MENENGEGKKMWIQSRVETYRKIAINKIVFMGYKWTMSILLLFIPPFIHSFCSSEDVDFRLNEWEGRRVSGTNQRTRVQVSHVDLNVTDTLDVCCHAEERIKREKEEDG